MRVSLREQPLYHSSCVVIPLNLILVLTECSNLLHCFKTKLVYDSLSTKELANIHRPRFPCRLYFLNVILEVRICYSCQNLETLGEPSCVESSNYLQVSVTTSYFFTIARDSVPCADPLAAASKSLFSCSKGSSDLRSASSLCSFYESIIYGYIPYLLLDQLTLYSR